MSSPALKDIWALHVRLQMEGRVRERALCKLGIDSKLRGCGLVGLMVRGVCHGDQTARGRTRYRRPAQDSAPRLTETRPHVTRLANRQLLLPPRQLPVNSSATLAP